MALNKDRLKASLEAKIRTSQSLPATPYPRLTAYCDAVAQAIVDEFTVNAEVDPKTGDPAGLKVDVPNVSGGGFTTVHVYGTGKVD